MCMLGDKWEMTITKNGETVLTMIGSASDCIDFVASYGMKWRRHGVADWQWYRGESAVYEGKIIELASD